MGRYYQLSKSITEEMAAEIMQEIREIKEVEHAELKEDNTKLLVKTAEDKYPSVMSRIVNISRRVGRGCDLSFCGFEV